MDTATPNPYDPAMAAHPSDWHDPDSHSTTGGADRDRDGGLRAIDAAANRAREAIRAIEDYCRFVLDDRHLVQQCKQLRHALFAALSAIPASKRLAMRETQADVGTGLTTESEQSRPDLAAVVSANCARLQEGLRSLEEFGKLLDEHFAAAMKRLRYESYTLERAVAITDAALERLDRVRLYVLLDGRNSLDDFTRLARSLVEAGVDAIQLRDKRLADRELIARARRLREACMAESKRGSCGPNPGAGQRGHSVS